MNCFKTNKSITKTWTPFCSYWYLPGVSMIKNIEKALFVSAGAQKR